MSRISRGSSSIHGTSASGDEPTQLRGSVNTNRFAEARERAGVLRHRILRPLDDERYVIVDLDFDTAEKAEAFLTFLRIQVWTSPNSAPALAGTPTTRILAPVE